MGMSASCQLCTNLECRIRGIWKAQRIVKERTQMMENFTHLKHTHMPNTRFNCGTKRKQTTKKQNKTNRAFFVSPITQWEEKLTISSGINQWTAVWLTAVWTRLCTCETPIFPPLSPQPPEKEENATDVLLLGYPFVLYNTAYFREW